MPAPASYFEITEILHGSCKECAESAAEDERLLRSLHARYTETEAEHEARIERSIAEHEESILNGGD